jgi:Fe-S oxidoreductase
MGEVYRWLAACVVCGMCEQACPKHLPLAAIHSHIRKELTQTLVQRKSYAITRSN